MTVTFNNSDKAGNRMLCDKDGNLTLVLVGNQKPRSIGRVIPAGGSNYDYYKYVEEKNIFRKNRSWGINDFILQNIGSGQIVLISDKKTYVISAQKAKEHGDYLWFKQQGFERQIFIPLKHFRQGPPA